MTEHRHNFDRWTALAIKLDEAELASPRLLGLELPDGVLVRDAASGALQYVPGVCIVDAPAGRLREPARSKQDNYSEVFLKKLPAHGHLPAEVFVATKISRRPPWITQVLDASDDLKVAEHNMMVEAQEITELDRIVLARYSFAEKIKDSAKGR
jgi:hypothetical protein